MRSILMSTFLPLTLLAATAVPVDPARAACPRARVAVPAAAKATTTEAKKEAPRWKKLEAL